MRQSRTEGPLSDNQKAHSFEGPVSMAGVAVVRGALDGPHGAVGTVNTTQTVQSERDTHGNVASGRKTFNRVEN